MGGAAVTEAAAYPMVPFCGRISMGRFAFAGANYQLAPNFSPEPHAIHGTGWQSGWAVRACADGLSMELVDETLRWPWPFMAGQTFRFLGNRLSLELSVTNLAEHTMPAGLGWHPFFPVDGAALEAATGEVWARHVDAGNPPMAGAPDAGRDPAKRLDMEAVELDHTFTWCAPTARIEYPVRGMAFDLAASPNARFLTVFRPQNGRSFCVEPLSHLPEALNTLQPAALGTAALAPGKSLTLTIDLSVTLTDRP